MACRGCSQVGGDGTPTAVVGSPSGIVVTGTGATLDPYVVSFTGSTFGSNLQDAASAPKILGQLADGTLVLVPAVQCCVRIV